MIARALEEGQWEGWSGLRSGSDRHWQVDCVRLRKGELPCKACEEDRTPEEACEGEQAQRVNRVSKVGGATG